MVIGGHEHVDLETSRQKRPGQGKKGRQGKDFSSEEEEQEEEEEEEEEEY